MSLSGAGGNSAEFGGANPHSRTAADTWQLSDATGNRKGNTYNTTDGDALLNSYESIFGPAGRDIKIDAQRHKRHQRWHLPDNLKGRNEYLTDRIDGLITDATSSPFTRNILPYVYLDQPDQKIKWNVYSFDEGMASRVPYESAARVLTQSKTSHAGYAVRQGLAIVMEHNFLASAAGMANFQNQLKQLVGSIQLTNDLDVHVALLQAASYQRTIDEKYYSESMTLYSACKQYVDMFGIMQKIPNALDILIEDAKNHLKTWGSQPPTFLLCPSDLTAQLQMSPERTNYITNGPDGLKRLAEGPNLPSYRGISIIHSQKFSLEPGRKPRNVLKRKVRVAEYYWIDLSSVTSYQLYNQKKDMMVTFDRTHAVKASNLKKTVLDYDHFQPEVEAHFGADRNNIYKAAAAGFCMLIRPNIEHDMLTVIAGRGGTQELGATFWGQTELACYDDAQHGIWGMSYKYHERAIVTNERNLIRMFDVAFDGYSGGMDTDIVKLEDIAGKFTSDTYSAAPRYEGQSMIALHFPKYLFVSTISNPLIQLLKNIFVPQLQNNGSDYDYSAMPSSDVAQCSLLLKEIHDYFKHKPEFQKYAFYADVRHKLSSAEDVDTHDENKYNSMHAEMRHFTQRWAGSVVACITSLTKSYQRIRPHEPRAELYERILQLVFKAFRGVAVESMPPARATQILTFLVAGTGDINGTGFQAVFQAVLEIMLMDFAPNAATMTATAGAMHAAAIPSAVNNPATEFEQPHEQTLTYLLCMLHGIVLNMNGASATTAWTYYRNGALTDHAQIRDFLSMYHRDDAAVLTARNEEVCAIVVEDFEHGYKSVKNLQYNLHLMQRPPFEVPNPLILSTILKYTSNNTVPVNTEGKLNNDKHNDHNFHHQYIKYLNQDQADFPHQVGIMVLTFDNFCKMYEHKAHDMWTITQNMPASAYIQNNETELPAMAYHGNLFTTKSNGIREEVRCVGHLGNSYPGCACIREGKGSVNMYERMPTAVHVI